MSKTILTDGDDGVQLIIKDAKVKQDTGAKVREPVHVIYGGADRFTAETPAKLGKIALASLRSWAPNFVEFAKAFGLPQAGEIANNGKSANKLKTLIEQDEEEAKAELFPAWLAYSVYSRTIAKLKTEPIEDLRIDFEDGYGFRSDEEEGADAVRSAGELAKAFKTRKITRHCGIRVKPFAKETLGRAIRTLDLFMDIFLTESNGKLPSNFVVTLPKVTDRKQVKQLCERLRSIEKKAKLANGSIKIEILIESPLAIIDRKGKFAMKGLIKAAKGRCTSAHFGAYDYTSLVGISADRQDIRHNACIFARQMMQIALSPLNIRLSDSVTTLLPVPIHKADELTEEQKAENKNAVHAGWQKHFANITASMTDGFFQSWDLHPNQLPARFAAVYTFYLLANDGQADRLKRFLDNATKASLSGNTFDDAASAQGLLNFFRRGIDCGALTMEEVSLSTGISENELNSGSFQKIIAGRLADS